MATPYLCRPIEHGADIVVHSLTKFLGGHGNSIGGAIIDSGRFDWAKSDKYPTMSQQNASYHGKIFTEAFGPIDFIIACRTIGLRDIGPALSQFNAFMILPGIDTHQQLLLPHCETADANAQLRHVQPHVAWMADDVAVEAH